MKEDLSLKQIHKIVLAMKNGTFRAKRIKKPPREVPPNRRGNDKLAGELSLRECSEKLGVTAPRILQIERDVLKKIERHLMRLQRQDVRNAEDAMARHESAKNA